MRRGLIPLLALLLLFPATAAAQRSTAPPGNAGIDEYLETVPAGGGAERPSGSGDGAGSLPAATTRELEALGADGELAAEVAGSAPRSRDGKAGSRSGATAALPPAPGGGSPIRAIVTASTGGSGGGTGLLLPMLLLGSLALFTGLWLLRRRAAA